MANSSEANNIVEWHIYDIELKGLLNKAESKRNENLQRSDIWDGYLKELRWRIEAYCDYHKIKFENTRIIPVKFNIEDSYFEYAYFLAHFLMLNLLPKTETILNFHFKAYSNGDDQYIINIIKNVVTDTIEKYTYFDNNDLLERIFNWANAKEEYLKSKNSPIYNTTHINQEREIDSSSHSLNDREKQETTHKEDSIQPLPRLLLADNKPNAALFISRLDNKFLIKKIINKKNDFLNVFINGTKIQWKGGEEYLAYLLDRLYNSPYQYIKATGKVGNEIWNSAEIYFEICDITKKVTLKNRFANAIYRVKKSKLKYVQMRSDIDEMLKSITENLV